MARTGVLAAADKGIRPFPGCHEWQPAAHGCGHGPRRHKATPMPAWACAAAWPIPSVVAARCCALRVRPWPAAAVPCVPRPLRRRAAAAAVAGSVRRVRPRFARLARAGCGAPPAFPLGHLCAAVAAPRALARAVWFAAAAFLRCGRPVRLPLLRAALRAPSASPRGVRLAPLSRLRASRSGRPSRGLRPRRGGFGPGGSGRAPRLARRSRAFFAGVGPGFSSGGGSSGGGCSLAAASRSAGLPPSPLPSPAPPGPGEARGPAGGPAGPRRGSAFRSPLPAAPPGTPPRLTSRKL